MGIVIDLAAERAKRAGCPGCSVARALGLVLVAVAVWYWWRGR